MALVPDLMNLTKEQTFSSVAKDTVHLEVALDNEYATGGYAVNSEMLFGAAGYNFLLLEGYFKTAWQYHRVLHNVATGKLQLIGANDLEMPPGSLLAGYTAYLTFARW